MVTSLILANVVMFVPGIWLSGLFAFNPSTLLLQPWVVVTHMFVHADLPHFAGNMLMLLHFGPELERRWSRSDFVKLYVLSGVGGIVLHSLFYPGVALLGASGAIMGLSLVSAVNSPDARVWLLGIFPPVRAKYLMGYAVVSNLVYVLSGITDGISYAAHVGGVVGGLAYLKYMKGASPSGAPSQPVVAPPVSSRPMSTGGDISEEPSKAGSLDIRRVEKITHTQAAQGVTIRVITGSGEEVEMGIPQQTTTGAHLRLPAGGHRQGNQVGNLWVRIKVED